MTDVLIIGGGPGGSAAAMLLIKQGIKPVVVEQEQFPRFHIGESMTGEAGALLRRLDLAEAMEKRGYPVKHGVRVFGTAVGSFQSLVATKIGNCSQPLPGRYAGAISMH